MSVPLADEVRGRSKVSPASEEEEPGAEMCALACACSSSLLLNAQLQLPLDLDVVVVDSALGLVVVVLVVVVGVVQLADCSGPRPLRAPRRDCRVQTRGS